MAVNPIQLVDNKILPSNDRNYLESKGFAYREINDGALKGLIIDNFSVIPEGKFNVSASSLLILLPQGYPDVPPDMFYFHPELKLTANNSYPDRANSKPSYFQIAWQCWSRHAPATDWRAGIDGIHSYIQRVLAALKDAS